MKEEKEIEAVFIAGIFIAAMCAISGLIVLFH